MRLDRLPIGEGIVGFLLVVLVIGFAIAEHEVGAPAATTAPSSGSPTASSSGGETTAPAGLVIDMSDNKFDHTTLTAKAGEATTVQLKNNGAAIHNVHVSDASGNFGAAFCTANGAEPCSNPTRLAGGASGTLGFTLTAGTYQYRCDYHPTEMKGTLTVQ